MTLKDKTGELMVRLAREFPSENIDGLQLFVLSAFVEIAKAAKLEERKRIEEALNNTSEGSCLYCNQRKECCIPHDVLTLDQVRSIINPK